MNDHAPSTAAAPEPVETRPCLSRAGLRRGLVAVLPLAPGALLFGVSLGLLADGAGMTLYQALAMSLTVFAGASQYLAVELWAEPLPALAIVLAALLVNARHVLMGATLAAWLRGRPRGQVLVSLFFLVDENWGLTAARLRGAPPEREWDLGFLLGSGLLLYLLWNLGTVAGVLGAGLVADPSRWGLDAFGTAMFTVLLLLQWRGRSSLLPWTIAAAAAVLAEALLPGAWYVLVGALAGSLVGGLRSRLAGSRDQP